MRSWKKDNLIRRVRESKKVVARDRKDLDDILYDIYNRYEGLIHYDSRYGRYNVPKDVENLGFIDVSNVKDMSYLFCGQGVPYILSGWDVSNVEDMNHMFYGAIFNKNISKWDVSNVEDMSYMFYYSEFDGDISNWDLSSVKNSSHMFD